MLNFLVYCVVLLLPLYLVRFSIFGIPTNVVEVLVGVTFILWFFQLKKDSELLSLPKIYWLSFLLIFLGITLSTLLNTEKIHALGIIKGWFVIPFAFFLILFEWIDSETKKERILRSLLVSSSGVALISLCYLLANQLTFDGRLKAFYLSPNHLAMFLVPGILIGFFFLMQTIVLKRKLDLTFYFPLGGLIILLIALYFTFSYGAWLALFSALFLTLILTGLIGGRQKIYVFFATATVMILLFSSQLTHQKLTTLVSGDERSSLASRMMIWESTWKIGMDNFVWGIGPGNFQARYLEYQKYFPPYLEWAVPQPHNLYLAFWLQGGILGLSGFLLLAITWTKQLLHALKNKKGSFQEASVLAVMLSILIHGLIDTPYWKNDLALVFWIALALGFHACRQAGGLISSPAPNDRDVD